MNPKSKSKLSNTIYGSRCVRLELVRPLVKRCVCSTCGGTVEVVATGKGEGKDAEAKHVCSKCGDDAMFGSAVKPGSGSMKDMDMKKEKK